jgi:hypothetical protein
MYNCSQKKKKIQSERGRVNQFIILYMVDIVVESNYLIRSVELITNILKKGI